MKSANALSGAIDLNSFAFSGLTWRRKLTKEFLLFNLLNFYYKGISSTSRNKVTKH